MRKVLVFGLLFGTLAVWSTGCTGGDDDDDDHEPPDSITISGGTSVTVGSSLQLTATAVGNDEGDITTISTWSTNSAGVATVGAATGLVTGVSAGTAVITAEHDGVMGQTTVTVSTGTAVTFDATVTGDTGWAGAHIDGTNIFVRIVDIASPGTPVHCEATTMTAANFNVAATGKLTAGHTYYAEVVADDDGDTNVSTADHKWKGANFGPVGADQNIVVDHGAPSTASGWMNGPECP